MKMEFDAEACAAYLQLGRAGTPVEDSWPLDGPFSGITQVIIDLDVNGRVLGVEILGRPGDGPGNILAAIATGSISRAMSAEGFDGSALHADPEVAVHVIG